MEFVILGNISIINNFIPRLRHGIALSIKNFGPSVSFFGDRRTSNKSEKNIRRPNINWPTLYAVWKEVRLRILMVEILSNFHGIFLIVRYEGYNNFHFKSNFQSLFYLIVLFIGPKTMYAVNGKLTFVPTIHLLSIEIPIANSRTGLKSLLSNMAAVIGKLSILSL